MNPNNSAEQQEQAFLEARIKEREDKVNAEFKKIFNKNHILTEEDKAFLRARRTYLTRAEVEEYEDELNEGNKETSKDKDLTNYTRKELEATLQGLGVHDTSLKAYKTNASLIEAIEELQA
jgi:hypothetical protein